ncbi:predicted protein [Streptomyces viridosporus ATCC 14672]|uniref:Predicted protein n=1 Tax=Streptomyces viridosporus (strain ATCC 14672 / DSM 40746 / JCM 4963 / KCTC 9882 / NRRL B-12104 / FH 1290) TaxID=566461 RepID=D5ZT58_STRV1|nr:predicted protein [Streptomyces viridosporus ATCC 14672]
MTSHGFNTTARTSSELLVVALYPVMEDGEVDVCSGVRQPSPGPAPHQVRSDIKTLGN